LQSLHLLLQCGFSKIANLEARRNRQASRTLELFEGMKVGAGSRRKFLLKVVKAVSNSVSNDEVSWHTEGLALSHPQGQCAFDASAEPFGFNHQVAVSPARRLHAIQTRDSRIGFEASNQYYYVPVDLAEKVIACHYLLEQWLPAQGGAATRR
jgi:hypothetical protein